MTDRDDTLLVLSSPLFDASIYARAVQKNFATPEEAAYHYLTQGGLHSCGPEALFDARYYWAENRDVREAGFNPLLHFLRHGRLEGRRPVLYGAPWAGSPRAPDDETWSRLRAERALSIQAICPDDDSSVDVVVPVYRGYDDTLACIYSVLKSDIATPYRLIAIDDESPEPGLSQRLHELAEFGLLVLLSNQRNVGFVQSANRGMSLSKKRDVVLLNSDTVVYGNWLDRLRWHSRSHERVATVTPFSNNATIFSYPHVLQNNRHRLELDFPELARIFNEANDRNNLDVPTGVGFCFYITRNSLEELGGFDERLFGRGYGEENDFCMRAQGAAWRNLAALDVFVRHTGERSFGMEADEGKNRGLAQLTRVFPHYQRLIREYTEVDPLKAGRMRVDIARFRAMSRGRAVLLVTHDWGGGIERHVEDLAALLAAEGIPSLWWKPTRARDGLHFDATRAGDFPNLPDTPWSQLRDSGATLKALGLGLVHIHSLVTFPPGALNDLTVAIRDAGLAYDFTLHDYAPVCPRINMIDWSGMYCDSPSSTYCGDCLARGGTRFGAQDIDAWRARYRAVLLGARNVFAPSQDLITRMARYLPDLSNVLLRPHPLKELPKVKRLPPPRRKGVRTVGIIGAIGPHKGSRVVQGLAADALIRELPLHFTIYGDTDLPSLRDFPNVTVTGAYREGAIGQVLASDPCEIALFASVWPETFCFTLDIAVSHGVFPIAFDLGAPADRIRAMGYGKILPLDFALDSGVLNQELLRALPPQSRLAGESRRLWTGADRYFQSGNDTPEVPSKFT